MANESKWKPGPLTVTSDCESCGEVGTLYVVYSRHLCLAHAVAEVSDAMLIRYAGWGIRELVESRDVFAAALATVEGEIKSRLSRPAARATP